MTDVDAKTIVLYADSGFGKSTQATLFAKYYYERTGLPVRLISAEDSTKTVFESLIGIDVAQAVFLTKAVSPLVSFRRLVRGEWPVNEKEWMPYKPNEVSAYIIEGLSSIAEQLLEDCRENHRFLGGQTKDVYDIGGFKFGPAGQTAYGFVQDEMLRALRSFAQLQGVQRVLWTAHESKGQDSDGVGIRGPGLVGNAKTGVIQKYCGMLLHGDVMVNDKKQITRRLYFDKHVDPKYAAIYYPAKVTLPSSCPDMLSLYSSGYIEPTRTSGLEKILEAEDKLLRQAASTDLEWKRSVQQKLIANQPNIQQTKT